jgi:hypothetical protein
MPGNNQKNAIAFKINRTKPISNISHRHVITLISVGKGINGERKIASEEELHVELLKQLDKHPPSMNIILVAGLLKRWNFWEMLPAISDEELARRLNDLPTNMTEEKLAPILAEKLTDIATSMEKKYVEDLDSHLEIYAKKLNISFPYKVTRWNQREHFDNCSKNAFDTNIFLDNPQSLKLIEATIARFLQNKKGDLETAKERLTKAVPQFSTLNFKKLVDLSCLAYLLEEYEYFARLKNTEVFYNGNIPPALDPIFQDTSKDLYWRNYSFKQAKILPEDHKKNSRLTRAKSSSYVDELNSQYDNAKLTSLAAKRLKLFSFLKGTPDIKSNTEDDSANNEQDQVFDTSNLSPKSSRCMMEFFKLYSKKPASPIKELAKQKIEEATALLIKSSR